MERLVIQFMPVAELYIVEPGLPYLNQKRNGDLLVEILVKTPTNLSARQEELLREFESSAEEAIGDKIIKGVENLLGGKSKKKKK